MSSPSGRQEVPLQFAVPPELEQGVYAVLAQVRGSEWDYTITFYQPILPDGDKPLTSVEARAVARVRIPRGVLPKLIEALQTVMDNLTSVDAGGVSPE